MNNRNKTIETAAKNLGDYDIIHSQESSFDSWDELNAYWHYSYPDQCLKTPNAPNLIKRKRIECHEFFFLPDLDIEEDQQNQSRQNFHPPINLKDSGNEDKDDEDGTCSNSQKISKKVDFYKLRLRAKHEQTTRAENPNFKYTYIKAETLGPITIIQEKTF